MIDAHVGLFRHFTILRQKLRRILRPFPYKVTTDQYLKVKGIFEVTTLIEEARVLTLDGEDEFLGLLIDKVQKEDLFFDIGGCVGLFSVHTALLGAKVIVFEPDPSYRVRLLRNISLNGLAESVRVIEWAVSDCQSELILYTDGVNGRSPSLCQVGERGKVMVCTDSIDNALLNNNFPAPTIIKIDIEGAEILALRGMRKLLKSENAPRSIFIELHPTFLADFGSSVDECVAILESSGYSKKYYASRSDQIHCVYDK